LRFLKLTAVAKLRLSSIRSPCFFQVHYSVVRLRGAGTVDPGFHKCLKRVRLVIHSTAQHTRAELVIVPTISPPDRP